jgi:predicted MFS family arabinose efflux permease
MIVDAVSYLASAVLLGSIRITGTAPPVQRKPPFSEMATGLRFVFAHPVIRAAAFFATAVNFANGVIFAAMTPFLVRTLGLPPSLVGLIVAMDGVGTVIGAALTARIARRLGSARALVLTSGIGCVVVFAMPLAGTAGAAAIYGAGLGAFALSVVIASVIIRTHRQMVSPPELLSRVMASVRFVSWSAIPIGSITAGLLAQAWSPRVALFAAGVASIVGTLVLWFSPIRHARDMTDAEPREDASAPAVP